MNLTPLPEPFYITRSNGRLYEVESGADVTGRVIDAYTQDQLRQAQREAVASKDGQIAKLEAEVNRLQAALHRATLAATAPPLAVYIEPSEGDVARLIKSMKIRPFD